MHYKTKNRWLWNFKLYWLILYLLTFSTLLFTGCSSTLHPYKSSYKCPPGYEGLCESMHDAYNDSVHEIDPREFDKDWIKKRKKWEKAHKKLLEARKKAGINVKVAGNKEFKNLFKNKQKAETLYRKELFNELSSLLVEPEKPMVIPPKIVRVLVLTTIAQEKNGWSSIFISPHYTYFMLDKPRWLLQKIPEIVPFDPENPMVKR